MQALLGQGKTAPGPKNKSRKECIVLIGMAGVGKSTIGKSLSKELDYGYVDLDERIIEKTGLGLQEIIERHGEKTLLKLERDSAYEAPKRENVIAPGGSIVYSRDAMRYLKAKSTIIYLKDDYDNIKKRINNPQKRGIIGLKDKTLKDIHEERKTLYERYADITIDCKNKTKKEINQEIKKELGY